MKIAYLILAHKQPAQLARLVRALHGPESVFYIHIDQKISEDEFRQALQGYETVVHFSRERVRVNWYGFSTVLATLALMRQCHSELPNPDRIVLLSGQCYPIKPNALIRDFFERRCEAEFMTHWALPSQVWQSQDGGIDRLRYYWPIDKINLRYAEKLFRLQKKIGIARRLPQGIQFFGGSQWFMLTDASLRYIVDYCDKNSSFVNFWRMTKLSDEIFFQTLLMNSKFAARVENNNFRHIDWLTGPETPRTLRLDNFQVLKESDCLFARKFDLAHQDSFDLMQRIDREILGFHELQTVAI